MAPRQVPPRLGMDRALRSRGERRGKELKAVERSQPQNYGLKMRHVVVPCARSLPVFSAITFPSAVAIRPPRCRIEASQRTRPVSLLIGRTKLTLVSSEV